MASEPDTTTHACGAAVFWHRICHVYRLLPLSDARCEGSESASYLRRRVQQHLRSMISPDQSIPLNDAARQAVEELIPVLRAFLAWDAVRLGGRR